MSKTAVAMSGGVDSSVAAALLVEAGRDVVGVTMRLGQAEVAHHPASEDPAALARHVCDRLGIEHVVVDLAAEFLDEVVRPFCDGYAAGLTPNPCVTCNERIKFGLLAARVRALGFDTLATGHYARLVRDEDGVRLERAADRGKDQSYFLYRMPDMTLEMVEFPLGELTKAEVRALAASRGLPTAQRRESQEVCLTDDHALLVAETHPDALAPGPIEDARGHVLGEHRGIARYTVGQRKGLGIGGPGGPYRVVRIDAVRRALIVAPDSEARLSRVLLEDAVWRLESENAHVLAQVRYRARPVGASVTVAGSRLVVEFDAPVGPLAPGQSVVMYAGDRVVGGGIVAPCAEHATVAAADERTGHRPAG
jgi:tRNA-specific 2-thiouridylase